MTNPDDGEFDPEHPDGQTHDEAGLDEAGLEEPAHDALYEEPPARKGGSGLPWVLTVLMGCGLLGGGLYSHQKVSAANNAAELAETRYEELHSRSAKMDEDRKSAVAQAAELTGRFEEASSKVASLTRDLKEKDAALSQLKDAQNALVTRLRAAVKGAPKGKLSRQVLAALPKPAGAAASSPSAPSGTTKTRHAKRGSRGSSAFP